MKRRRCFIVDKSGEEIEAIFHVWGTRLVKNDDGLYVPETVAIVEINEGGIVKIDPEEIQFAD